MENKLIKIHHIEPETKLDKLDEEIKEFKQALDEYRNTGEILPLLKELADCLIIAIGIAIVRHGMNISEFKAIMGKKVNRRLLIKGIMKEKGISYDEARKLIQ